jgi:hypothetical protein
LVGTSPIPKVGQVIDPVTGSYENVPFIDNKKILAQTTTVLKNLIILNSGPQLKPLKQSQLILPTESTWHLLILLLSQNLAMEFK